MTLGPAARCCWAERVSAPCEASGLACKCAPDRIGIHRNHNAGDKIANIPDQPAFQPVRQAGIECMLKVFVNGDGLIGGVEKIKGDLHGLHDHED